MKGHPDCCLPCWLQPMKGCLCPTDTAALTPFSVCPSLFRLTVLSCGKARLTGMTLRLGTPRGTPPHFKDSVWSGGWVDKDGNLVVLGWQSSPSWPCLVSQQARVDENGQSSVRGGNSSLWIWLSVATLMRVGCAGKQFTCDCYQLGHQPIISLTSLGRPKSQRKRAQCTVRPQ